MSGNRKRPAGSLKTGEPAFLAAGKIRRPHGVRGEVLLEIHTDFPERLQAGKTVFLGESHEQATILQQRQHQHGLLLRLAGYDTPEAAGILRNQTLYVAFEDTPELPEGEYYFHELLDLEVFREDGKKLGVLSEIIETGANDVYVVTTPSGSEILLPAIQDVILSVSLEEQKMTVHLLPGLIEDDKDEA